MSDPPAKSTSSPGPSNEPGAGHDTDADLVVRARRGCRISFGRLYDRHARLIRALCYDRCGDRESANELTQEAFLRAYHGLDKLRDPERFVPWLIQISRNLAVDAVHARVRHRRSIQSARDKAAASGRLEAIDGLEKEDLLAAVRALPEPDRSVIRLFYLSEQPADQARSVLGLSRSGFYKALDRARSTLRRRLDPAVGAKP